MKEEEEEEGIFLLEKLCFVSYKKQMSITRLYPLKYSVLRNGGQQQDKFFL